MASHWRMTINAAKFNKSVSDQGCRSDMPSKTRCTQQMYPSCLKDLTSSFSPWVRETPKYPEVSNLRLHSGESLLESHIIQNLMRTQVLNIHSGHGCLYPQKHRQTLIMNHRLRCLNNRLVLSLCNPILMGVVRNSVLPLDPCLNAEITEILGGVLSSII
jgi:hypothetical protein